MENPLITRSLATELGSLAAANDRIVRMVALIARHEQSLDQPVSTERQYDSRRALILALRASLAYSRTSGKGLVGVSLAVSRGIAESHGGTLTVHSDAGAGSQFCLRLPLADEAA